ncbi:MAG: branched-chain amino acid transaminase [Chloroflexi bacterium]|nr:branched-chain amino acid transaminase [Chloroflexota bacterium]
MPPYAYFEKQFIPLAEARIGILTHALHYGTACFEGIRGNWNPADEQIYLFRCPEHYQRLAASSRVLKIKLPYTVDELCKLTVELVARSGFREDVYVRPVAYKSTEMIGVRLHDVGDDFFVLVTSLGPYLEGVDRGIRCCISSWRRVNDNMIPARAKVTGLYVNSALAKSEAIENGFAEAILLNQDGYVSEGSGENIFIVSKGRLITPPGSDNILMGITRDTVITLAREELGIDTIERSMNRSELYMADECFLTGTAAHITPVVEIDRRTIGPGSVGPITSQLQRLYFDVIGGRTPKYSRWCLPAYSQGAKVK